MSRKWYASSRRLVVLSLLALALSFWLATTLKTSPLPPVTPIFRPVWENTIPTQPNLKVAFIGDQGLGNSALDVLKLIRSEGAELVIHLGDFDYQDDPVAWEAQIDAILGEKFPYFAVVGNHDVDKWPEYKKSLESRLARLNGANCTGDYGVNSSCTYKDLFFILSGVGTLGENHEAYIKSELAKSHHTWKICAWHKTQNAMQVGGKNNDTGWEVYEACKDSGAIITTGHEHSYQRTKTLTSLEEQTVDSSCSNPNHVCLKPGASFVAVSGLGGHSIRDQKRCLPETYPYGCQGEWAKIYTKSQDPNATFGALFISFNVDKNPRKAHGYFKTIDGKIIDDFEITRS